MPDRIVILPGWRPIFVELKTAHGRLSAAQRMQIKQLQLLYQKVVVLCGMQDVKDFLADLAQRMGGDAR